MIHRRQACYCAFCKTPRKVYRKKNLNYVEVLGLIFLGVLMTMAVFRSLDPRGLGFVGILLIVGEVFAQLKWRGSMLCNNCGFDPVLYVRNPEQAGLKIKAFLEKRAESPAHLLKPPVILPKVKADSESKKMLLPNGKDFSKAQNLSLKI